MKTLLLVALIACLVVAGAPIVLADAAGPHYFTFYAQQAWPKQTNTNNQIQEINDTFGTDFEYAVAHFLPWPEWKAIRPFVYGGIGFGYESDTTTLDLKNQFIDAGLRVENDGWFPTYTAGIGMDVPFSSTTAWYFEVGVAYVWSRMTNEVPATGALAPAPTVTADTDFTGPNYWLGVGLTF